MLSITHVHQLSHLYLEDRRCCR